MVSVAGRAASAAVSARPSRTISSAEATSAVIQGDQVSYTVAIARYRGRTVEVVYAAAQSDNAASLRLFESRGFREVARKETGWQDGGLGAWGLRSRMRLVPGERLLGLRLRPRP